MVQHASYHLALRLWPWVIRLTRRFGGASTLRVIRRIGVAVRFVFFPAYGGTLPGMAEDRTVGVPTMVDSSLPDWVVADMQFHAEHVDPSFAPDPDRIRQFRCTSVPLTVAPGNAFRDLVVQCRSDTYTHCFIVPSLDAHLGAAGTLPLVRWASQQSARVLIVVTGGGHRSTLPSTGDNVDIFFMHDATDAVTSLEFAQIWSRFIIQSQSRYIHIFSARFISEVFTIYCRQIAMYCTVLIHLAEHRSQYGDVCLSDVSTCIVEHSQVITGIASPYRHVLEEVRLRFGVSASKLFLLPRVQIDESISSLSYLGDLLHTVRFVPPYAH